MPRSIAALFYYTHKRRKTSPAETTGIYHYLNRLRNDSLPILIFGYCYHCCDYVFSSTYSDLYVPGNNSVSAAISSTCNAGIGVRRSIVVDLQPDIYLWLTGSDTYKYTAEIRYSRWNTCNLHSQLGGWCRLRGRSRVGRRRRTVEAPGL